MAKKATKLTAANDSLLDEVKDAVDRLGEADPDQCRMMAVDLIEYLELHYKHREK